MSVKLYITGGLHQTFGDSHKNLQGQATFRRAVVATGTWIFYTFANYNDAQHGGSSQNYKILVPGQNEDISTVNGSMYLVPDAVEGLLLFEHNFYGGERQWYNDSCSDLTTIFPAGTVGGVSSAIVLAQSQTFAAFTKVNYQGLQNELKPGKRYDSPEAMNFPNDQMQSVRKM